MALSKAKAEIVMEIERNIERGEIVDGVYSSAKFDFGKNSFEVVADYCVDGNRVGSAIFKNGELYGGSIVSNGRYRSIGLYVGANLMEHQLLAIALIPNATADLLRDDNYFVINHKTISSEALEWAERRREYRRMAKEEGIWDESLLDGAYIPPCDVRDLEICTSAENNAHGAFIHTFELYNYSISAKDVDMLKSFLINEDYCNMIMQLYVKYGTDGLLNLEI